MLVDFCACQVLAEPTWGARIFAEKWQVPISRQVFTLKHECVLCNGFNEVSRGEAGTLLINFQVALRPLLAVATI